MLRRTAGRFCNTWTRVRVFAHRVVQARSFRWVSMLSGKTANAVESNDCFYDMLPKDRMQRGPDDEWIGGVKAQREYTQRELVGIVRHMQTLALLRPPGFAGAVEGEEEQVNIGFSLRHSQRK